MTLRFLTKTVYILDYQQKILQKLRKVIKNNKNHLAHIKACDKLHKQFEMQISTHSWNGILQKGAAYNIPLQITM